jgi:diguanylate cyclase (GGDEF)-like protein/PAS domain S-box-containing protein
LGDTTVNRGTATSLEGILGSRPLFEGRTDGRRLQDSLSSALLQASVDCVIAVDGEGRIVEWNPAAEHTFGHSRERALGADLAELVVPAERREDHRRSLIEVVANPEAPIIGSRVERVGVRADGEHFPIELTIARVPGPEPIAVGFIRDISERKHEQWVADTNRRRREAMTALAHQVLRNAPLEEVGIAVAVLAREELGADVVRIWRSGEEDAPLELVASAGDADEARHGPPPMPSSEAGSVELADGLVFRVMTPNGPATAIALHSDQPTEPDAEDLYLLESLCQILVASISHHATVGQLEKAEGRYRGLVERLPMVSYLAEYGGDGAWLYVSPQIEELLGYTAAEWIADSTLWQQRIHPDDRPRVLAEEERSAESLQPGGIEYRMVGRDGRIVWVRDEGSYARRADNDRVLVEGVLLDITERRQAEEGLRYAVDHDELTGLANRRRFADELRRRRIEDGRGALVLLDLDDLKYVNDSLGHAAGDDLLRSVSLALDAVMRPGEFLARIGGDEFTILLDVSTEKAARRRLAAILRAVRGGDEQLSARASCGAVLFDRESTATDEDLLIAADIAMRAAKEHGGDRYQMFTGSGSERLAWVGHLRAAIDGDRLALHHQPIFDLANGELAADEILVRMIELDGSVVAPGAFLPTAERFGLIREIDRWVIAHAIEAAAGAGPITINVSARSISDPGLPHHIAAALRRSGADPANVVFEITETAAATASDELRAFGARIERLGCALAIDDFGTGFGSLTYLKHLPVRYLKIDMEFVRGINDSAADRAIVQSIVTIAKSLGMQTIGEGVEDEQTLQTLTGLGVDYAQGYHLGRPVALSA